MTSESRACTALMKDPGWLAACRLAHPFLAPPHNTHSLIGKALQDGQLLDLPLALPLCRRLLLSSDPTHPSSLADVALVDPSLGHALLEIKGMAQQAGGGEGGEEGKLGEYLAALHLHFTLPGADWWVGGGDGRGAGGWLDWPRGEA